MEKQTFEAMTLKLDENEIFDFYFQEISDQKTPESNSTRWDTWVGSSEPVSPFLRMMGKVFPV